MATTADKKAALLAQLAALEEEERAARSAELEKTTNEVRAACADFERRLRAFGLEFNWTIASPAAVKRAKSGAATRSAAAGGGAGKPHAWRDLQARVKVVCARIGKPTKGQWSWMCASAVKARYTCAATEAQIAEFAATFVPPAESKGSKGAYETVAKRNARVAAESKRSVASAEADEEEEVSPDGPWLSDIYAYQFYEMAFGDDKVLINNKGWMIDPDELSWVGAFDLDTCALNESAPEPKELAGFVLYCAGDREVLLMAESDKAEHADYDEA